MSDAYDAEEIAALSRDASRVEAEERRDALRFDAYECYRHDYQPDGHGNGVCVDCGSFLPEDEL